MSLVGVEELKKEQSQAITSFVNGKDVFVALPTVREYGKPFCYALLPLVLTACEPSLTSVYFLKVVKAGTEPRYWCISAAATECSCCKLSNSEEYTALTPAAFPSRLLLSHLMEATSQLQILHTSNIVWLASLRYG